MKAVLVKHEDGRAALIYSGPSGEDGGRRLDPTDVIAGRAVSDYEPGVHQVDVVAKDMTLSDVHVNAPMGSDEDCDDDGDDDSMHENMAANMKANDKKLRMMGRNKKKMASRMMMLGKAIQKVQGKFAYIDEDGNGHLPIHDKAHAAMAAAALSPGGFRGNKAKIPSDKLGEVKARVRAAWKHFNPDKDESEMPDSIKKNNPNHDPHSGRFASGADSAERSEKQKAYFKRAAARASVSANEESSRANQATGRFASLAHDAATAHHAYAAEMHHLAGNPEKASFHAGKAAEHATKAEYPRSRKRAEQVAHLRKRGKAATKPNVDDEALNGTQEDQNEPDPTQGQQDSDGGKKKKKGKPARGNDGNIDDGDGMDYEDGGGSGGAAGEQIDYQPQRKRFSVAVPFQINKLDEEEQIVYGWASVANVNGQELLDLQGDVIDMPEIRKAAHEFMLNSRVGGEMHLRKNTGVIVESLVIDDSVKKALKIDTPLDGWFIGYKVTDQMVWQDVKAGKYPMFSIGGTGVRIAED